jgi:hypothetical protein
MFTPRYSWNYAKVGIKHQSINQSFWGWHIVFIFSVHSSLCPSVTIVCTQNAYILHCNSSKPSCLLIIIWRYIYHYSSLIWPFIKELFSFCQWIFHPNVCMFISSCILCRNTAKLGMLAYNLLNLHNAKGEEEYVRRVEI